MDAVQRDSLEPDAQEGLAIRDARPTPLEQLLTLPAAALDREGKGHVQRPLFGKADAHIEQNFGNGNELQRPEQRGEP
jgi:hypothetical protein